MFAICPNDPTHDQFITVAHVAENWIVDREGNYQKSLDGPHDVVAPPNRGNIWNCRICNAEAIVHDEKPIGEQ